MPTDNEIALRYANGLGRQLNITDFKYKDWEGDSVLMLMEQARADEKKKSLCIGEMDGISHSAMVICHFENDDRYSKVKDVLKELNERFQFLKTLKEELNQKVM